LNRIYASFDGAQNRKSLSELCLELLSEQKITWPELYRGYASMDSIKIREIACNGFNVCVQHNPGRIKSTLADVKEKEIKERPCFLCENNLPEEQQGIFYRNEYLILCNPMPVFPSHFTICHKEHKPQSIVEHADILLQLMVDLGKGWTVLYNGPRCGASAPDHLHFQTVPAGQMPVEAEIAGKKYFTGIQQVDGVLLSRASNIGRETIVLEGENPIVLTGLFREIISALKKNLSFEKEAALEESAIKEPMMNVMGFHNGKRLCMIIFPRAKHRPEAFFREGDDRLMISPAVVEMGGVLVTPVEKDFEGMNATIVEGIFQEVTLDSKILDRLFDSIICDIRNTANQNHRPEVGGRSVRHW
jgi:hypothetical protein